MAHVTRIKANDKKSEEKPQSTSKNIKKAVKMAKEIVKEQKETSKVKTKQKAVKEKKPMPKALRVITAPFRFIAKPFIAFGNYIYNSWLEIRQVRWPNRKATWKLVGAIFLYAAFFIVVVALLDALFNFIFSKIIG